MSRRGGKRGVERSNKKRRGKGVGKVERYWSVLRRNRW